MGRNGEIMGKELAIKRLKKNEKSFKSGERRENSTSLIWKGDVK